ncbi:sensor histidine kinase [Spongiibacter sp. UBA1325]|uniref:sensor histidine kinase n=2 Tax=Spongiibacter TaxID=630749 RepID=UPI00257EE5F4|nr:ATP-binding protein [Spongiibacter sp. UBA1325]|tara:strand:- start:1291 stop:2499 length:1209 start_codon:yes stop_codon:yes gene_type:complete
MNEFWRSILGPEMPPHGHCYLWNEQLVFLHVLSDTLITLSYFTIPIALIVLVKRRDDLKFNYMFLMFAVFIFACGTTHLVNILNVWYGAYWLSGTIKAITAIASVGTAILVWPLIPKALALPSNAQLVELNNQLQNEIAENRRKQEEVERLSADLQSLVTQRTEELAEARLNKTLLEKTNESLSNSNTALEEFSRASNEGFVEPLRVIDVYSKRLQERAGQELSEESRQWLSKVCEASSQASRLNAGLQRYSQLPLNEPVEELSLDSLVSRIIDDEAMADVVSIQPPGLGTAVLPGGTLTLVIRELLRNAKRFSGQRPLRVDIGRLPDPTTGGLALFVRDNGRGIPAAQQKRVFALFEQFHSEGEGVGLASIRRLVSEYGGRVSVISDGESGSEFRVEFPLL